MSSFSLNCPQCKHSNRIASHQLSDDLSCQSCHKPLIKGTVVQVLPHNFVPLSGDKKPLILFISGPNCGICKSFSTIFAGLAKHSAGKYYFGEAYLPNNKAIANKLKLRGVPAIAIFKQGKIRGLVNGGMRKNELLKFINDSLD